MKLKKNLEIKFYIFSTFRKMTGGFVNQLIKISGLTVCQKGLGKQ